MAFWINIYGCHPHPRHGPLSVKQLKNDSYRYALYVPGKDLSRCLSGKELAAAGSFLGTSLTVRKVYEPCLGKIIFFYRWWCHFDDDNYVHVLRLAHLLQSYSADRPVYLGKPSTARPIEIWDLNAPQVRTYFLQWFINDFAQENTLFDMQMYQKGS